MSVIAAIYDDHGIHPNALDQMCEAMDDLGRDSHSIWPENGKTLQQNNPVRVVLVAAMQRTLRQTRGVAQPITSEDGQIALIFDGYLANFDSLRESLSDQGYALRDRSDEELVLRAYERWGTECARHLDGEFAFIIVDLGISEVFCARDHRGLRPLFYHHAGDRLVIANDLAALVGQIDPKPKPDLNYLACVAADKWFAPEATPWQGIKRLLPAHAMRFSGGNLNFAKHWSLKTEVTIQYVRDEDYVEHYLQILTDCVRKASRSQLPVGFNVSGGLDSSAIFALAHQLHCQGKLPAPDLRGYTLVAQKGSPADELGYARAVARHLAAPIREIGITQPSLDWFTERPAKTFDIPIATNGAMTMDLEEQAADDGCRVLIGGDGGDEWLQGSVHYYRQFLNQRNLPGFFQSIRSDADVFGWAGASKVALRQAIAAALPEWLLSERRKKNRAQNRGEADHLFWMNNEFKRRLAELEEDYIASLPSETVAFSKTNLAQSPNSDMANTMMQAQYARAGLQRRSPMLMKEFIEFSAATPEHIRARAGQSKYVHRQSMRGILPVAVVERATKANFPSPELDAAFAKYVRDEASPLLELMFDEAGLARLLATDGRDLIDPRHSWEVWGVYACAAFLRHHA